MINDLIQKATNTLWEQQFTELTIRMSFLNYWMPFAAELEGAFFCRELVDDYVAKKYEATLTSNNPDTLSRSQRKACHAFNVLLIFHEKGIIASSSMKFKQIRQPLAPPEQKILDQYLESYRKTGDAESTLDNRNRTVHPFLRSVPIGEINENTVLSYFTRLGATLSKSSMKTKMGVLKSFLSYCTQEGILKEDFCGLFPKYKGCSGLNVPSAFTIQELQELLLFMENSRVPNQKRNHAMAVLMVSYGFRVSEIWGMKLSDINWDDASITIRQSKTGTLLNHKLTTAAGNSLASYLLEERPESPCDKVFLKRDGCAIGSTSTISNIISIAFINSGIRVGERRHGSHCLRHSLATAMLNNGIGIFEISRVLGHACADTSRIYSKVDIESLRLCGLEVPCHG